jgi:hypothetical protein
MSDLSDYNEYMKDLAKLHEYIEAFEKAWKCAPTRELENSFFFESSPEEQETIIAQLLSDAEAIDKATAEGIDLSAGIDWSKND